MSDRIVSAMDAYSTPTTGRDLAAERVRRGLHQRDVAARLGVSRSRIASLEWHPRPTPTMVGRYLEALREPAGGR